MSVARARREAMGAMLLAASTAAGCFSWVAIKPTELPKLNGSHAVAAGAVPTPSGVVPVGLATVAHVERPDGTLVEIKGKFDAEVDTRAGSTTFDHPVNSVIENNILEVQAGNRAKTPFPLQDVTAVRVSQYAPGQTAIALVLASAAIVLLTVGVAVAAAK